MAEGLQTAPPHVQTRAELRSLRRGIVWTFLGSGVYLGCQYLTLMVLTRLTSRSVVGQFSLAMAIWTPVIVFSQMQLRQIQMTDARGRYLFGEYFTFRVLATVLAIAWVMAFAMMSSYSREMIALLLLVGIAKSFESISDVIYGRVQRHERRELIATSMALRATLSFVLFASLLYYTRNVVWAVGGMALAWGTLLVVFDLPMVNRVAVEPELWRVRSARTLAALAMFSAPMGVTTALQTFSANLPRYFVESFHGREALAMFTVAAAPLALLTMLTGAVCETTLARSSRYLYEGRLEAFRSLALKTTVLPVILGIGFTALLARWGELILTLLFTEEYRSAAPAMVIMSAGITVGNFAILGATVLAAGQMFRLQLMNIALIVAVQIPLCYVLVPSRGIIGASWADFAKYLISGVFVSLAGWLVYRKRLAEVKA